MMSPNRTPSVRTVLRPVKEGQGFEHLPFVNQGSHCLALQKRVVFDADIDRLTKNRVDEVPLSS